MTTVAVYKILQLLFFLNAEMCLHDADGMANSIQRKKQLQHCAKSESTYRIPSDLRVFLHMQEN